MMETTDVVICHECGKRVADQKGIIFGEKFGNDHTTGLCENCINTAHYLLNRSSYHEKILFDVDKFTKHIRQSVDDGITCAIFDIDGTLCDERLFNLVNDESKRATTYFPEMADASRWLSVHNVNIVYLSARMSEYRCMTEKQLNDNGFHKGTILLYDGDPLDPEFPVTTTNWKAHIIQTYIDRYKNILVVDDNAGFLTTLETLIYTHDEYNIINFGRCSMVRISVPDCRLGDC